MKWTTFCTCSILALAIAGCGDSGSTTTAPAAGKAPTTAEVQAAADKLIADATQYVKDHKWELADQAVAELDKMKANLSPENAKRVDDLKKALETAKAATRSMPKMP